MAEVAFRKVAEPYGWLQNMAPFPILYDGHEYYTSEHLFQVLRVDPAAEDIRELIRAEKSPMAAKMMAKKHVDRRKVVPQSEEDVRLMAKVLRLKIRSHPELLLWLLDTGEDTLIEDSTKRRNESGLFWGAAKQADGTWTGHNILGRLWMALRKQYRDLLKAQFGDAPVTIQQACEVAAKVLKEEAL